jgi:hypothetical protein
VKSGVRRRTGLDPELQWAQILAADEELLDLVAGYQELYSRPSASDSGRRFVRAILLGLAAALFLWLLIAMAAFVLFASVT